jgi:subtilase family serine protease
MITARIKNQVDLHSTSAANFCHILRSMCFGAVLLSILCPSSDSLGANGVLKSLQGHVPEASRYLLPKAALDTNTTLRLALGLPLKDEIGLELFLQKIYDPSDPLYQQFLTPDQFEQRFSPTPEQYEKVVAFAQRNHLTVTVRHSNRLVLDVAGSVADVQRAFHTTFHVFKHPREQRDFFAPDIEPSVETDLPLVDISGLNNYMLPRPRSVRMAETSSTAVPRSGSGENGAFFGNDFRAAYLPEVTLTGAGQILGMVQFDGFYPADIAAYETAASLPQVPLQTVLLDGYDGVPTSGANSGNGEVSLDIEMAVCMAPGLSKIVVFEAGPNGFQNDILSAMASHAEIKQLSCSWGWGGGPSTTTDNLFKKMAAQGQSFFSASGDSDAFSTGAVDDPSQVNSPSSSPYITVVGGVTLMTSGPGGARASEAVWNRGDGVGSSGGISSHYAIPSWQAGINMMANGGSTGFRNTPDVAWVAENISVRYGNGITGSFGGTSCAAPLWAGLAALMNQQAVEAGKPSIGFINPAIYALGKGAGYGSLFNDVTNGNNTWSGSANAFDAVAGFDLCTGWGSPAGQHLIDALAGPLTSVKPLPSLAFTSIEKSVSGCKLSWQSADALRYQLQSTADLLSSNWLNVGPVITGTGQVITAEDPGATDPSAPRFYRLLRTQ